MGQQGMPQEYIQPGVGMFTPGLAAQPAQGVQPQQGQQGYFAPAAGQGAVPLVGGQGLGQPPVQGGYAGYGQQQGPGGVQGLTEGMRGLGVGEKVSLRGIVGCVAGSVLEGGGGSEWWSTRGREMRTRLERAEDF